VGVISFWLEVQVHMRWPTPVVPNTRHSPTVGQLDAVRGEF